MDRDGFSLSHSVLIFRFQTATFTYIKICALCAHEMVLINFIDVFLLDPLSLLIDCLAFFSREHRLKVSRLLFHIRETTPCKTEMMVHNFIARFHFD